MGFGGGFWQVEEDEWRSGQHPNRLWVHSYLEDRQDDSSRHSIPTKLRLCSTIPYVPPTGEEAPEGVDLSLEHTTVDSIQDFYYVSDLISEETGESRLHDNPDRSRLWGGRIAESFDVDPSYVRCDRSSWLFTGDMPDFSTAVVKPHVDPLLRRVGCCWCCCVGAPHHTITSNNQGVPRGSRSTYFQGWTPKQ